MKKNYYNKRSNLSRFKVDNLNEKQKADYDVIRDSKMFDEKYYIKEYGLTKGANPIVHFLVVGVNMGFNPSYDFDTGFYSKFYPDVMENGLNPFVHYIKFVKQENRIHKFLTEDEIEKLNISEEHLINYLTIKYSEEFDEEYYVKEYELDEDIDPIVHFLEIGVDKGYNPSPDFDTKFYLKTNDDVRKNNVNPFIHYLQFGKKEARLPNNSMKISKK